MRALDQLSGPWVGFWIQDHIRGSMGLGLEFSAGRIVGKGHDLVGGFSLKGAYTEEGGVQLTKRYAWHVVHYTGKWDGQMIYGKWTIKHEGSGEFEIWPESDRYEFAVAELEEEREKVGI